MGARGVTQARFTRVIQRRCHYLAFDTYSAHSSLTRSETASCCTATMDSHRICSDDKARVRRQGASSSIRSPFYYPIKWLGDIMAAIFRIVSPYTTNLIPLVVFLLSIPVIAVLSASAGYLVWKSIAVGWETDVVLQYG